MKRLCLGVAMLLFATNTFAQWSASRPDGHAPISIMGDHTHSQGEIMFSYRFMFMNMDGNGDGTEQLTNQEVRDYGYMVSPTTMPMYMHMLGAMYAASDDITFMVMLPYSSISMDHEMMNGNTFTTESSGLGDIKLSTLISFYAKNNSKMHASIGLSLPTGSIEHKDATPSSGGNEIVLPYPMQTGSGSFDFKPGVTYLTQTPSASFGAQLNGTIRLNDNNRNYRLGNRFEAVSWAGYRLSDVFSPQFSLRYSVWGDISGADTSLNPNMIHTADPDLKAGSRIDLGLGLNIQGPEGPLHDLRVAFNYDLPVYQNLDGPQMWNKGILIFGLQYTIH